MSGKHQFPPALDGGYPVRDGRIQTRSLEAHVVDHCNLTCAECCSLSPLLPRWLASPASLERDLARARTVLAPGVFKLVGGEPLLHPELVACLEVARRSGIAPVLSITTNGLLLERSDDALWQAVDALTISLYPQPALSDATVAAIAARAARFGVTLNWKRQDQFVKMTRERRASDEAETRTIYQQCWIRERCHMLREGVFYTCTRPPHFSALYRGRLDFTGDGIPLDGDGLRDALLAYLGREQPLAACAHCYGGNATLGPHRLLSRAEVHALRGTVA
jgi:GTP 3',8-cyclase